MWDFTYASPESVGIRSSAIRMFLRRAEQAGIELHSLVVARHGVICCETYWEPFGPDELHQMFSFTKSLTSTAIGFAVQEGKMRLEDKLCDILAPQVPEDAPENIRKATIHDLLTMSCGHEQEPNCHTPDWVQVFLRHETPFEPGTVFQYNSAGTCMLCLCLKVCTGENLFDYLRPRLFDKIGIRKDIFIARMPGDIDNGGFGSKLHTMDMARFIQFVLNRGSWGGEQLLSAEWFDRATAKQIETDGPVYKGPEDWLQGYCYQFWRCKPEGVFRADGAFGQFGFVMPRQDAFVITTSATGDTQTLLTALWDTVLASMADEPYPENLTGGAMTAAHHLRPLAPSAAQRVSEVKWEGVRFAPEEELTVAAFMGDSAFGAGPGARLLELGFTFLTDAALLLKTDKGDMRIPLNTEKAAILETAGGRSALWGRWRSGSAYELEVRGLDHVGGSRLILRLDETGITLERDPVMFSFGGPPKPLRLARLA